MTIKLTEYTVNKIIDELKQSAKRYERDYTLSLFGKDRQTNLARSAEVKGLWQFIEREIKRQHDTTPSNIA